MISSILATAVARPTRICARSLALLKSNLERLAITSSRNPKKASSIVRTFICSGLPPFNASMLELKFCCIAEYLNNWFRTTSATASRLSSITTRIPTLSDSSRTAEIPSILFSLTRVAIFLIIFALFT